MAAGARVERALEILGDDVPDHLRAASLRIENKQASLEELGQMHEPPLKGRRRAEGSGGCATADKRAAELGIPNTEASLSAEMLDEVDLTCIVAGQRQPQKPAVRCAIEVR